VSRNGITHKSTEFWGMFAEQWRRPITMLLGSPKSKLT
jgi:hypothetical protein